MLELKSGMISGQNGHFGLSLIHIVKSLIFFFSLFIQSSMKMKFFQSVRKHYTFDIQAYFKLEKVFVNDSFFFFYFLAELKIRLQLCVLVSLFYVSLLLMWNEKLNSQRNWTTILFFFVLILYIFSLWNVVKFIRFNFYLHINRSMYPTVYISICLKCVRPNQKTGKIKKRDKNRQMKTKIIHVRRAIKTIVHITSFKEEINKLKGKIKQRKICWTRVKVHSILFRFEMWRFFFHTFFLSKQFIRDNLNGVYEIINLKLLTLEI